MRPPWTRPPLVVALVVLAVANGCGGHEPTAAVGAAGEVRPATNPASTAQEIQAGVGPKTLIEDCTADLASRLQAPPERIQLRGVESVMWPNTALGCPILGVVWLQVVTPGYRITLQAAGGTHEYHTDARSRAVYYPAFALSKCAPHLAERLGVPVKTIGLVGYEEVVWPTPELGCPQPGTDSVQTAVSGFRILLRANDALHEYHTDLGWRAVYFPALALSCCVADLAERAGVAEGAIDLVGYEEVVWPTPGLGCPEPGTDSAQMAINGFRIVLRANGALHEYHTNIGDRYCYCVP